MTKGPTFRIYKSKRNIAQQKKNIKIIKNDY